ncbi:RNA 2',3'-cyclic phosphodiesterase [Endozoicomonas sp. SCSIO W0465]|uniref:RNA 2',3'-cyclic phosphodiesterase n=1 Tax=Endozoicomonas sp. SCSIO W0465 TaxID=2918516 RepID=UPI002075BCBE|nr:RNA 2',3'-cyclic phosphodiesterase [Endozoicomonas sp. SCSIO W0465]USE34441.1 RNA 2',3'-cyclic phosphodiesterase [Endozoicomonas sp. SCSIO W0465]
MKNNHISYNAPNGLTSFDETLSRNSLVRAFLAVRLPLELAATLHKKAIHRAGERHVHDLRWVAPQQQHITLKFLGNSYPQQLQQLVADLENDLADYHTFDSMTGCFRFFPNGRTPRVLALEMHSGQELKRLSDICEQAAVQSGFSPETRSFRPHVTLGRFKHPGHVAHSQYFNLPSFRMTVAEVVLLESVSTSIGTRYKTLYVFPLRPLAISA